MTTYNTATGTDN